MHINKLTLLVFLVNCSIIFSMKDLVPYYEENIQNLENMHVTLSMQEKKKSILRHYFLNFFCSSLGYFPLYKNYNYAMISKELKTEKRKYIDAIKKVCGKLDLEIHYHEIPYKTDVDMEYYDYYAGDTQITILTIKNTKNRAKNYCVIDIPAPYQTEDNENVMNPIFEKCLTNIPSCTPIKLTFRPRAGQRSSGNLVHYFNFFIERCKENIKVIDLQKFNLSENDPFIPTLLTLKNIYPCIEKLFLPDITKKIMINDNFLSVSPETKNIISCQKEEKVLLKVKIEELYIENKEVERLRVLANNPWM